LNNRYPMDHKIKRPNGPWTPSTETDITKAWDRARQQLEEEKRKRDEKVKEIRQIGGKSNGR
jgi:hypothetical protein